MVPRHGAVEKWLNSPDFLSDIRRFESCRHHHRPRQLSRQSIGLKIRASLVQFQVQAPIVRLWCNWKHSGLQSLETYVRFVVAAPQRGNGKQRMPIKRESVRRILECSGYSAILSYMLCYFSGRKLPLQGRGRWFESTTEYHLNNRVKRIRLWNAVERHHSDIDHSYNSCNPFPIVYVLLVQRKEQRSSKPQMKVRFLHGIPIKNIIFDFL